MLLLPIAKILFLWIVGILIFSICELSSEVLIITISTASLFFIIVYKKRRTASRYLEHALLVMILWSSVQIFYHENFHSNDFEVFQDKEHRVQVKIKERYKETTFRRTYIVELQQIIRDSVIVINTDCLLYQKRDTLNVHFYPGDRFYADIYWKEIPKQKHPALFDSFKFWNLKGITQNLWLNDETIEWLEPSENGFYRLRKKQAEWVEMISHQNLSASTQQIIAALVLGEKRAVDSELRSTFSSLGLSHMLALSGLHVGFIYAIFAFLFSFILKYSPVLQSVSLSVIIVLYAALTGLSPSVMRASLMFLLYALSIGLGRRTCVFNLVFVSAFLLLLYDKNLLFDVGFQLSYLAVLGILYFHTFFKKYLEKKSKLLKYIMGLAFVSISAQLSTGILSVYYFHSFPLSFLWANVFILPMMMILLFLSLFYIFLLVSGFQPDFFGAFLDVFVHQLLKFMRFIEEHSFSSVLTYVTSYEVYYFYGLLVLFCLIFLEKKVKLLRFLYSYLLLGFVIYHLSVTNTKELFVNASKNTLVVSIFENKEQIVLTDNAKGIGYLLGDYSLMNHITCIDTLSLKSDYQNSFFKTSKGLIELFNERLLILENQVYQGGLNLPVDLIIQRNYRNDLERLYTQLSPKCILIDPKIPNEQRRRIKEGWLAIGVEVVDLNDSVYTKSYL